MRYFLGFLVAAVAPAYAHDAHATLDRLIHATEHLIAALEPEQKTKALLPFEGDHRSFFHYIPSDDIPKRYGHPRPGLTLKEMTMAQKHLTSAVLAAALSAQGYIKTTTIMSLEDVLRVLENDKVERRSPEKYHLSIFGTPGVKGPWGLRFEGHHVSLHFTVVNGVLNGNPTFFGSNPAEVRQGPRKGLRVLGAEEDKARALLDTLTPEQWKLALVSEKAYPDILTETQRKASLEGQPKGLPAAKLTPAQRKLLDVLIAEYIDNLPEPAAAQRRERLKQAGSNLYFAWAGVKERGGPHYYRVQAPTFLIEYDNTQNGANHIHAVWRDFTNDWGGDLLEQHYKTSPHHQPAKK